MLSNMGKRDNKHVLSLENPSHLKLKAKINQCFEREFQFQNYE